MQEYSQMVLVEFEAGDTASVPVQNAKPAELHNVPDLGTRFRNHGHSSPDFAACLPVPPVRISHDTKFGGPHHDCHVPRAGDNLFVVKLDTANSSLR